MRTECGPIIYFIIPVVVVIVLLIVGFIIYHLLPGPKTPDFVKELSEYAEKNGYEFKEDVTEETGAYMSATDAWGFHGQQARYALIKKYDDMELMHFFFTSKHGSKDPQYETEIRYLATIVDMNLINGAIKLEIQYPGDSMAMGPGYDKNFENKQFSDMYLIGSNPDKFAYDFFTPRMIEAFLEAEVYRMIIRKGSVVIYNKVNLEEWKQVPPLLQEWAQTQTPFFEKINGFIPGYLRKKKTQADEESEEPKLELTCPKCESDFSTIPVNGIIKCPECGAKGTV